MALNWLKVFLVLNILDISVQNTANTQNDIFMCMKVGQLVTGTCLDTEKRLTTLEEQVKDLQNQLHSGTINTSSGNKSVPKDCLELHERGYTVDGIYKVSPDGRRPFNVYCDLTGGGWSVIQKRFDGTINFHQNWDTYVVGFGDLSGEHWLGLESIHRLTKDSSEIHFSLQRSSDDEWVSAHYKAFTVHDASSRYRMNVDSHGYESNFGEWFSFHDGMMFSTHDRDNDVSSSDCANAQGGGGWWFKNCYRLGALNALFGKEGHRGMSYWTNAAINVKTSIVKVKSRLPYSD